MSAVKKCITPDAIGSGCVPEIYVTPTEAPGRGGLPGMMTSSRRDSTNSNLSCSLPNLAVDDADDENGDHGGEGGGGGGGGVGCSADTTAKPKELSIYFSPRPSRRNGEGNKSKYHHNGQPSYPFLKCIGKPYRERLESTDSNDSDCSASHQSTCATSDYTHLTSLDMINILSLRDQYQSQLGLGSSTTMDMLSDYGTLRRTHSNPENCMLTPEESKQQQQNMETSDSSLRDSKSCTNLEQAQQQNVAPPAGAMGNQLQAEVQRPTQLVRAENDVNTNLLQVGNKSLAVSEENLHSRVNRWLGSIEKSTTTTTTTAAAASQAGTQ